MADFTALKTAIQNAIKQNGNEEITGNILQDVLLAIVSTLGDGSINDLITALGSEATTRSQADGTLQQNIDAEAQARQLADSTLQGGINTAMQAINAINNAIANGCVYAGIATPSSTPASGKVFYLALTAGTYTNYGGLEVPQGINILKNNGSTWLLDSFWGIDDAPIQGSDNLVKSGGVLNSIIQNGPAFDLSAYNAQGGVLATYADLSAALTALNALPADFKKGGMSMKYVQTSDNKYVQYRLTANTFTIDVTQWAVCDDGVYVENPEFVAAYTDKKKRLLFAIGKDGNFYFGAGCPQQIKDYISSAILYKVDKIEGKGLIDTEVGNSFEYVENPEYIAVGITKDKQILNAIYKDGHSYIYELSSESIDRILNRIKNIDETTVGFTAVEDPEERLKVFFDAVGKIIAYRDKDGILHENVGISSKVVNTDHLELTPHGMNDFKQALKDSGFNPGGAGDYSEKEYMYISEPRLAHLNIIGDVNMLGLSKEGMDGAIEGVNYNVPIQVEFTDDKGNYFLKYALLSGQGRSSLQFLKKGLGMDFFNEDPSSQDFDEDNVFTMKFGDWIPQDSFHIKSFYTDWPRCTTPVVYKLANEVFLTRGLLADRPFKKYYVGEYDEYGGASANTQSDLSHNMETGARCVPDGFPVIVYLNGEFWGVNSWQLKKHRDNYMLNKKKDTNIHLDGDFLPYREGSTPFWLYDGTIDWSMYCSGTYGIETRNPKNLYCVDGKKYNADTHDAEIIDTATAEAWIAAGQIIPTGKTIDDELAGYLRTTGKVRKNIEDLTRYIPDINRLISGETLIDGQQATTAQIKAAIEDRFDVNSFIDYILVNNVVGNDDAWSNNGQMVTWGKLNGSNNLNWSVNLYDCDVTFGCLFNGTGASPADGYKRDPAYPLYKIFWDYYYDELKARYHELRDKGIFDADHITGLFRSWMDRVGYDNYKKEYKKWPESPCFRDGSHTYVNNPTTGGFYGSIERIYLWTKKRIEYMDGASFFDYSQN